MHLKYGPDIWAKLLRCWEEKKKNMHSYTLLRLLFLFANVLASYEKCNVSDLKLSRLISWLKVSFKAPPPPMNALSLTQRQFIEIHQLYLWFIDMLSGFLITLLFSWTYLRSSQKPPYNTLKQVMIQYASVRIELVQHQYNLISVFNMSGCILSLTVTKRLCCISASIWEQSTSHLRSPRYGRSGRDWLSHEVIVIARGTSCHVRVWATGPGVCAPSRHHRLLRLPWRHTNTHINYTGVIVGIEPKQPCVCA